MKFLRSWAITFAFAALLLPSMGSGDSAARFDKLGHQMMCTCGCGQILLECNHLGCPVSPVMRNELLTAMNAGQSDQQIFDGFIREYGQTVMGAPVFRGFNILAWIMPIAALLLGTLGAALLIHNWKQRVAGKPRAAAIPISEDVRARIRRETDL